MTADIERALAPLVGLPLWGSERESNMLSLQIGERRGLPLPDGETLVVGTFALYVFCTWRLVHGGEIVGGSGDLFTPSDPEEDVETFDWEEPGSTWWDERMDAFFTERATTPLTILSVRVDSLGGFRMECTDDVTIEAFANSSAAPHVDTEFWRLLAPGTSGPHVVMDTSGLRIEQQS